MASPLKGANITVTAIFTDEVTLRGEVPSDGKDLRSASAPKFPTIKWLPANEGSHCS